MQSAAAFRWPLQRDPLGHLRSGLVREGQEKDTSWIYPLIQQALNSRHQRAGLSGARSSLEKERVPAMVGCRFLLLVEWNFDRRFCSNYWHRGSKSASSICCATTSKGALNRFAISEQVWP